MHGAGHPAGGAGEPACVGGGAQGGNGSDLGGQVRGGVQADISVYPPWVVAVVGPLPLLVVAPARGARHFIQV